MPLVMFAGRRGAAYDRKNSIPTVMDRGGSIMVWGIVFADALHIIDGATYRQILETSLGPCAKSLLKTQVNFPTQQRP